MKRTINMLQAALLAAEYEEMMKAVPSIKAQIQDRINVLSVTDEQQEKDIKDLETALQCVKEQISFYSDAFRSYSRRNGKLKEAAAKDSPENLEKYTAIRQQAEQIISDFEAMGEAVFRRIRIKQMAHGVFLPSQSSAQQSEASQQLEPQQQPPQPPVETGE